MLAGLSSAIISTRPFGVRGTVQAISVGCFNSDPIWADSFSRIRDTTFGTPPAFLPSGVYVVSVSNGLWRRETDDTGDGRCK